MQRSVIDESSPRAPCRPSAVAALSRTMKKSLGAQLVVVVILAVIVLERTFTFRSRQPQAAPVAVEPLDTAALAQRLAGALRFKTISFQDSSQFDAREFDGFQRYLRTTFPKLHAALKLEKVNGYGLLYEWPGSDPSVPPIVLLAHQDVVPVEPGTETRWTEPPFDGRIAGGYVWGRGALDDKGSLVLLSPGRIRKFTSARADDGSTFSLTPACSTVGAVVVRSIAFPWGVAPNFRARSPPSSQRFAMTSRGPNDISGPR